ncbi:hypothetical protein [Thalassobacillus hwangdonensis]|uniref:Uncharacterized protein n=1 Tax=Thalassobacillus hwangdonensis TaxID=546108 RepID=A0ABW3L465_9BACI
MTKLGILGITHDEEMQKRYNLTLDRIESLIDDFRPDVICGEVHPESWELYLNTGESNGILGETQQEYPSMIYPYCDKHQVTFIPVDWFEEDVFEEDVFDRFPQDERIELEAELERMEEVKLATTWDAGEIPLNSVEYDQATEEIYRWLNHLNPDVQQIRWNARHHIMIARVKKAIQSNPGKRILCLHGADHNYWYHKVLKKEETVEVVYPLKS